MRLSFPLIGLLSFLLAPYFTSAIAEELDSIAAIVNGKAITCYEVEQDKQRLIQQIKQSGQGLLPSDAVLEKRALESRIVQTLQHQEATALGLSITDEEIEKAMADIETKNGIPAGQLPEVLKAQNVDLESYRETMRERLLSGKVVNTAVRGKLSISEESMREYYRKHLANPKPIREINLAQIFIALPSSPKADDLVKAEKRANETYAKLINGSSFKKLAALVSDDPGAKQGGEMGWFFPGGITPQFEEVFSLPVGGMLSPIRTPVGFHIVKVIGERMHEPKIGESFDEVHARHILIKLPAGADQATEAKIRYRAATLARELKESSDEAFATRAKEISQGPSAERGGDLGWFGKGQMVAAFEDAAFSMKPGETSDVVESDFGLHVIRLIAKRHIDPNAFEIHHDRIEQVLINAEMQNQVPRWIASLKAKAVIDEKGCR